MKEKRFSPLRACRAYPVLAVFALFLTVLFAADMLTPDRAYSELENTTLAQRPKLTKFSAEGLNSYFTNYTKYVKDQVVGRDAWIGMQSFVETELLRKEQSGGILLGKADMMFPRTYSLLPSETRALPKNMAAMCALAERWAGKVSVMLVPSAAEVYPEYVPAGAPLLNENTYIDEAKAAIESAGGSFVDVRAALGEHRGEYIYYRTDHHWTTLGAYYAYEELCSQLGLEPFDLSAHAAAEVPGFYGTHYSKARKWNAAADTITYYELPNTLTVYTVTGPGQPEQGETMGLYDEAKLDVYDKYAMFLHGNNGLSRIEGDGEGSILVIKDSFANSFVPYLTANYAEIDIVDFRNYNYGIDALVQANDYSRILVLYSFDSFKSDPYLYRAGAAG